MMSVNDPENRYRLTKSRFFQNTTLVRGSGFNIATEETRKSFGVYETFSGFVFQSDMRHAYDIFRCGFYPPPLPAVVRLADASKGEPYWSGRGFETYFCFAAACGYQHKNHAYLIDARGLKGIPQAVRTHRDREFIYDYLLRYEIVRRYYTVTYTHPIPGNKVVGIARSPHESGKDETSFLFFYINPGYVGGRDGARDVVQCFNDDEWVLV